MFREFERDVVVDGVMKGRTSCLLMLSRASHESLKDQVCLSHVPIAHCHENEYEGVSV